MRNAYKNKLVPQNDILVMLINSNVCLVFSQISRIFDGNIQNSIFHENRNLQIFFKFVGKIVGSKKKIINLFLFDQQYPKCLEDTFIEDI